MRILIGLEIYRNREFYRTQDVRPPFTYASLIRQVRQSRVEPQIELLFASDDDGKFARKKNHLLFL